MLLPFCGIAQDSTKTVTNRNIIKYNYATYSGKPIKKGWLFSDSEYKKLYNSYTAMDSLINYFEMQREISNMMRSMNGKLDNFQNERIQDKDDRILEQQETIGALKLQIDESAELNKELLGQFFKIGKIRLHKGTTIKVAIGAALATYLIVPKR